MKHLITHPLPLSPLLRVGHPCRFVSYSTPQGTRPFADTKREKWKQIPVIDVKPFLSGSNPTDVVNEVDYACRNVGFFYIKGHGVSQTLMDEVIGLAQQFFSLPRPEKEKISITKSKCFRGYQSLGQNVTLGKRDWHEAIDLYSEDGVTENWKPDPKRPVHGRNLWPENPPLFRPVFEHYLGEMNKLGAKLMRMMAVALGKEMNFFDEYIDNPYWVMRVCNYPPFPSDPSPDVGVSTGAHTDYGCLTMVNQSKAVFGLEVQNTDGEWVAAEPIPGTFVINIGDMLSHWTGGQYTSTLHRVRNNTTNITRTTIPFFFEPNYDAFIRPILPVKEGNLRFPKEGIMYGDHLVNKVTTNFDFKEN